jgi:hypothetical protein
MAKKDDIVYFRELDSTIFDRFCPAYFDSVFFSALQEFDFNRSKMAVNAIYKSSDLES